MTMTMEQVHQLRVGDWVAHDATGHLWRVKGVPEGGGAAGLNRGDLFVYAGVTALCNMWTVMSAPRPDPDELVFSGECGPLVRPDPVVLESDGGGQALPDTKSPEAPKVKYLPPPKPATRAELDAQVRVLRRDLNDKEQQANLRVQLAEQTTARGAYRAALFASWVLFFILLAVFN